MSQVFGYIRVSTKEQAKDGVSLKDQEEQIRTYCQLKKLPEPTIIRDEGVSGATKLQKRNGGRHLVHAKDATIIVTKMDRLFRSSLECLTNLKQWEKAGCTIHILNLGGSSLDTQSAIGKLFISMMAGIAEFERDMISERVRDALSYIRASGKKSNSNPPYGYRYVGKDVVEVPEEMAMKVEIARMRDNGLTLQAIADALIRNGIQTPNGGKWTAMQVKRICDRQKAA